MQAQCFPIIDVLVIALKAVDGVKQGNVDEYLPRCTSLIPAMPRYEHCVYR